MLAEARHSLGTKTLPKRMPEPPLLVRYNVPWSASGETARNLLMNCVSACASSRRLARATGGLDYLSWYLPGFHKELTYLRNRLRGTVRGPSIVAALLGFFRNRSKDIVEEVPDRENHNLHVSIGAIGKQQTLIGKT